MEKIANVGPKGTNFQQGIQAAARPLIARYLYTALANMRGMFSQRCSCGQKNHPEAALQRSIQRILIKLELLSLMQPVSAVWIRVRLRDW